MNSSNIVWMPKSIRMTILVKRAYKIIQVIWRKVSDDFIDNYELVFCAMLLQ